MKKLLIFPLFIICYLLLAAPSGAAEQLEPGGTPENCYVCRDRKWYLASGDGTCPKDKEVKECKKDDESTFGGCIGGDAVVGETCESTQEDKLGVSEGKSLFSPDNAAKLIPYGETGLDVSNEAKSAEFFEDSSKPFVPTPTPQAGADNSRPVLGINISAIFQDLVNRFREFFALLFKGGIGTFQTIYTLGANPPNLDSDDVRGEFNRGARDLRASLLPATNVNPFRNTSGNASAINISAESLKDIIKSAAHAEGIPPELLMAISQTEGPGTFAYSEDDVQYFSTDGWWEGLPESNPKMQKGYCYNTCSSLSLGCPANDVRGAMQFEIATWNGYLPQIKSAINQGDNYTPNRCNLRDSFVGAAVKIKQDAGLNPIWDENTIKYKVAQSYCGTCNSGPACGPNYCGNVWQLFNSYKAQQP